MAFLLPRHRGASAPLGPRPPPPAFRPGNRPGARPLRPVLCLPLPLAGTMRRHWENPRLSSLREGQLIAASIPPVTSGLLGQEAQAVTGPGWDAGILGAVCPAHAPLAEALSPPGADSGAALSPPRPLSHPSSTPPPPRVQLFPRPGRRSATPCTSSIPERSSISRTAPRLPGTVTPCVGVLRMENDTHTRVCASRRDSAPSLGGAGTQGPSLGGAGTPPTHAAPRGPPRVANRAFRLAPGVLPG